VAKKRLRLSFRMREGVVAVGRGKNPCTSSDVGDGAGWRAKFPSVSRFERGRGGGW